MDPQNDVCESISALVRQMCSNIQLPSEKLYRFGLNADPFRLPFTSWLRLLLSVTGEQELLLATALLCRALGVSWHAPRSDIRPLKSLLYYNRHRAFLVALIVADKFLNDDAYKLSSWRRHFPYWDAETLLSMELGFLGKLGWRVDISPSEFARFLKFLGYSTERTS
eukprot:Rmarinus@m.7169